MSAKSLRDSISDFCFEKEVFIIFDLDGVIIDSDQVIRIALKEAYNKVIGPGDPPYEEFFKHMGDHFPMIMDKIGLPLSMWEPFKWSSVQNIHLLELFPEIYETFNFLDQANIIMGLLTGKDYKRTIEILRRFEIEKYFKIIVTPEKIPRPKPFPDGLIYSIKKLGTAPKNMFYIGDAVNDMLCANSAGVNSIMAKWGAKYQLEKVRALATYTAETPKDLTFLCPYKNPLKK